MEKASTKLKIKAVEKYLEEYTLEEKEIIVNHFFPPNTPKVEMVHCMNVAKQLGLNPILGEIYFIERRAQINGQYRRKIEPMLGVNSYLTIAHRSGKFDGFEVKTYIDKVPKKQADGSWKYEDELVAEAIVWRKDMKHPIKVKVAYSEYVQRTKDGRVTQFWSKMPLTMLGKVALSQALRKAFNVRGALDFYENTDSIDEEIVTNVVENDENSEKDAATLLAKNKNKEKSEEKSEENAVNLEAEPVEIRNDEEQKIENDEIPEI
jgi:phage recombination protein Bet